jgi:hypothetical protein
VSFKHQIHAKLQNRLAETPGLAIALHRGEVIALVELLEELEQLRRGYRTVDVAQGADGFSVTFAGESDFTINGQRPSRNPSRWIHEDGAWKEVP